MKISNDLLKAIAVGVTLGLGATSCDVMEKMGDLTDGVDEQVEESGTIGNGNSTDVMRCDLDDCFGCGMG